MKRIQILTYVFVFAAVVISGNPADAQIGQSHFESLMRDYRQAHCFEVREFTRSERVAVGSDMKVVRWSANDQKDQRWVFHKTSNGRYRIESLKEGIGAKKWLAVGSDGRLVLWTKESANKGQEFTLRWLGNRVSLQENTRDEYLTVSNFLGHVVRWGKHGNDDDFRKEQTFELINKGVVGFKNVPGLEISGDKRIPATYSFDPKSYAGSGVTVHSLQNPTRTKTERSYTFRHGHGGEKSKTDHWQLQVNEGKEVFEIDVRLRHDTVLLKVDWEGKPPVGVWGLKVVGWEQGNVNARGNATGKAPGFIRVELGPKFFEVHDGL